MPNMILTKYCGKDAHFGLHGPHQWSVAEKDLSGKNNIKEFKRRQQQESISNL